MANQQRRGVYLGTGSLGARCGEDAARSLCLSTCTQCAYGSRLPAAQVTISTFTRPLASRVPALFAYHAASGPALQRPLVLHKQSFTYAFCCTSLLWTACPADSIACRCILFKQNCLRHFPIRAMQRCQCAHCKTDVKRGSSQALPSMAGRLPPHVRRYQEEISFARNKRTCVSDHEATP